MALVPDRFRGHEVGIWSDRYRSQCRSCHGLSWQGAGRPIQPQYSCVHDGELHADECSRICKDAINTMERVRHRTIACRSCLGTRARRGPEEPDAGRSGSGRKNISFGREVGHRGTVLLCGICCLLPSRYAGLSRREVSGISGVRTGQAVTLQIRKSRELVLGNRRMRNLAKRCEHALATIRAQQAEAT